jgi:hypothetical protein
LYDWTDFRDDAEAELLDELGGTGVQVNFRQHQIEEVQADGDGTGITCSFASEAEMVVFKGSASAVW